MWNLIYDINELIYKTETDSHRNKLSHQRGKGQEEINQEFRISRYKLLYINR